MDECELRERSINQINRVKEFGVSLGIPLETMFNQVEEPKPEWVVYAVWRAWPDHPDAKWVSSFGLDKANAKKTEAELQAVGYDTFTYCLDVSGNSECQLNEQFVRSADPYKTQVILEEGIHVWVDKHFACGEEVPLVLNEALANFMSINLAHEWGWNNQKNQRLLYSQYTALMPVFFNSINALARAVKEKGGIERATDEVDDFLNMADKFKKSFACPKKKEGETRIRNREDVNLAVISYYREYAGLFFQVWQYFYDNNLSIPDFLANPYPHRKALMHLTASVR